MRGVMPNNIIKDMRNQTFLTLLLLSGILLCFISCKKGVEDIRTEVYGTISDYYSGKHIANATIKIISRNNSNVPFIVDTILSTSTNEDGEYDVTFHGRREDYISYGIFVNKQPEGYRDVFYDRIKKKHSNQLDLSMKGNAYLKVHIKNITPFDNNDKIDLSAIIYFSSGVGNYVGHGTKIDTSVIFSTEGQGSHYMKLEWFVTKNEIDKFYIDSIYCNSLDTAYYSLLY
jgi:hypothetical protein